jgi:hypothetical protein
MLPSPANPVAWTIAAALGFPSPRASVKYRSRSMGKFSLPRTDSSSNSHERGPTDLHRGRVFGIKASELLLHAAATPWRERFRVQRGAGAAA